MYHILGVWNIDAHLHWKRNNRLCMNGKTKAFWSQRTVCYSGPYQLCLAITLTFEKFSFTLWEMGD